MKPCGAFDSSRIELAPPRLFASFLDCEQNAIVRVALPLFAMLCVGCGPQESQLHQNPIVYYYLTSTPPCAGTVSHLAYSAERVGAVLGLPAPSSIPYHFRPTGDLPCLAEASGCYMNDGKIFLVFQIQEGFFAPGNPDRRPDDSRLRENRIPDGALEQLQDRLLGFLVARGFFSEDDSASANSEVGCRF